MGEVPSFSPGGYRYIKAVFQYSGGVAAERGFEIHRARLARPLPLADGFALVESHLKALGRPSTAFCACELRSPEPFTEPAFVEFNRVYVQTLERWGLYKDGVNPVGAHQRLPGVRQAARTIALRILVHGPIVEQPRQLHRCRWWGSAGRQGRLSRAHRALWRRLAKRAAREGAIRNGRDAAAAGGSWVWLAHCRPYAGLHRARHRFARRRGNREARRGARRPDMASVPPAGRWTRLRNGCARRRLGTRALARRSMPTGGLGPLLATV